MHDSQNERIQRHVVWFSKLRHTLNTCIQANRNETSFLNVNWFELQVLKNQFAKTNRHKQNRSTMKPETVNDNSNVNILCFCKVVWTACTENSLQ